MISTRRKDKIAVNQGVTLNSVITRMEQCDLKANASKETYIFYSKQLKGKKSHEIPPLLTEILDNRIFPNTVILNQLIKRLSQLHQLQLSLVVHKIAVTKGLANAITYNSTLDAIAKSAQPDAALAVRLLEEAKKAGLADAITYASTLDAIAKSAQPDAALAVRLLEEAKKAGLADAITYASTLDAIAKSAQPDAALAVRLLEEAKKAGLADAITYNSTLDAIAKSAQPDAALAVRLLEEAKKADLADAITYASTLDAVAKSAQPDAVLAVRLLEEAKKAGLADAITYNSTLDAIAKSAQPDAALAVRLLEEAKKAGLADAITYASTLDAIAKSAQPDAVLAVRLLEEAIEQFKLNDMRNRTRLDLHGLSFGMVYFGLKRRVQQEMKAKDSISALTLIYGKGLHSRSGEDIHPVKQAILCVVTELSDQGVSGQENRTNPGVFELSIQPRRIQFNASNPNRLFSSTPRNPYAKSFVPKSQGTQPPF